MNAEAFAKMKKGAYIVNTARGPLIDEAAMIAALESGQLGGAGLDVVAAEPLAKDSPLLGRDNVIVSPHTAFYSIEALERIAEQMRLRRCARAQRREGGLSDQRMIPKVGNGFRSRSCASEEPHDRRADPTFRAFVFVMRIEPPWIDYNGHLNVAYYNVLFDRAVDEVYELLGIGPGLSQTAPSTRPSWPKPMCAICANCSESDPVRVTIQLLDYDAKRIHLFEKLLHAEEGWVSATSENMTLHVDMTAKKVAPFPGSVLRSLAAMKAAHAHFRGRTAPGEASRCRGKASRSARRKTFAPAR